MIEFDDYPEVRASDLPEVLVLQVREASARRPAEIGVRRIVGIDVNGWTPPEVAKRIPAGPWRCDDDAVDGVRIVRRDDALDRHRATDPEDQAADKEHDDRPDR